MSDNQNNGKPASVPIVQVIIEYDPNTGDVSFSGPGNQLMLYGMLVAALEMAMNQGKQAPTEASRLLVPGRGRFGPF